MTTQTIWFRCSEEAVQAWADVVASVGGKIGERFAVVYYGLHRWYLPVELTQAQLDTLQRDHWPAANTFGAVDNNGRPELWNCCVGFTTKNPREARKPARRRRA